MPLIVSALFGFLLLAIAIICLNVLKLGAGYTGVVLAAWFAGAEYGQHVYDRFVAPKKRREQEPKKGA